MPEVTDEEKFLFDVQGYLIVKGAIDTELVKALDKTVTANEATEHDETWAEGLPEVSRPHYTKDSPATGDFEHQIRLNGLLRLSPIFDQLIGHPSYLPYLKEFMVDPQLVNAWSISKYRGCTNHHWHNGTQPHEYAVQDGKIRCTMLNVITMVTPNHPGDGCLAVIPGSHNNNFTLNYDRWGWEGLSTPGTKEIIGDPGDVIIMSESLTHTGTAKTTSGKRTNLQYNHVDGRWAGAAAGDPHNSRHTWMPPSIRQRFTQVQLDLTRWMDYIAPHRPTNCSTDS